MTETRALGTRVLAFDSLIDLRQRHELTAPAGSTVAEMVAAAFPGAHDGLRAMLRVTIGDAPVPEPLWARVRPRPGTTVLIRPVPGNDVLRNVLTIAVTVGAIALGQFYGPMIAGSLLGLPGAATGSLASLASAAITGSVLVAGQLLINALVPVQGAAADKPSYSIQGLKNQLTPEGVVPKVLGRVRQAPVYACLPYTEIVGDDRYIVAAFLHDGYGPLDMGSFRIGDTPVERFFGVQYETRPGRPDDAPLSIVTRTVLEKVLSVQLRSTGPYGGPQSRFTAADVGECSIDVSFPKGLRGYSKDGSEKTATVALQIAYRLESAAEFTVAVATAVSGKKGQPITRSFPIVFPERGRYEVRVWRTTRDYDDEDQSKRDTQYVTESHWTMLRSIRPEYPIAWTGHAALSAVRILATGQLNGMLDEWNSIDSALIPDWDAASGTWIERATSNPASHFRYVLTGPAITYPLAYDQIDAALREWHAYCAAKGLTYNRVHAAEASVLQVLGNIAAAGRASPHDSGTAWGVVVDRALDQITQHISPRNSWGFQGERPYAKMPDAWRISFLDKTNGWAQTERVVPRPGLAGDVRVTEQLELPGVDDPDQVWREGRRRFYELVHRPDTYTVNQDWEHLAAGRGDRVQLSHDVLDRMMVAARVKAVAGNAERGYQVALDEVVTMEAGGAYAVRFRRDTGSLLRTVRTVEGESQMLRLTGAGELPAVGDLAMFGTATRESLACTVKGVEAMADFTARLTLVDHAPQIEALVDADVPPPWNGRVGQDVGQSARVPGAPTITAIDSGQLASGAASADNPYPVVVALQPADTVALRSYAVQSRRLGATDWALATAPAANGAVLLPGYAKGDEIELRARSVSAAGLDGTWGEILTHVVAATDPAAPSAPQGLTVTAPAAGTIRAEAVSSAANQNAATRLYVARGASAAFTSATAYTGDQVSGPNTRLPAREFTALPNGTALTAGDYRVWATALDGNSPPIESVPFGPVRVTVT